MHGAEDVTPEELRDWAKQMKTMPPSLANGALPNAPYSRRAPSPPIISIPAPIRRRTSKGVTDSLAIAPSYANVDLDQLTSVDLDIITRRAVQTATDRASTWNYEDRRRSQRILDFLYLGPTSAARDHDFLRQENITMIVVVTQVNMPGRQSKGVDKACQELGIHAEYVDMEGPAQIISCFTQATRLINDHLLAVHHEQVQQQTAQGGMLVEPETLRRANVLITCETGNDRSAAVTAAYIMAVFGRSMVSTIQFINVQRFCCSFSEDTKRVLQSWQDIIRARSTVAKQRQIKNAQLEQQQMDQPSYQQHPGVVTARPKRGVDDMMDVDDESGGEAEYMTDRDRFLGRESFTPFMDRVPENTENLDL